MTPEIRQRQKPLGRLLGPPNRSPTLHNREPFATKFFRLPCSSKCSNSSQTPPLRGLPALTQFECVDVLFRAAHGVSKDEFLCKNSCSFSCPSAGWYLHASTSAGADCVHDYAARSADSSGPPTRESQVSSHSYQHTAWESPWLSDVLFPTPLPLKSVSFPCSSASGTAPSSPLSVWSFSQFPSTFDLLSHQRLLFKAHRVRISQPEPSLFNRFLVSRFETKIQTRKPPSQSKKPSMGMVIRICSNVVLVKSFATRVYFVPTVCWWPNIPEDSSACVRP